MDGTGGPAPAPDPAVLAGQAAQKAFASITLPTPTPKMHWYALKDGRQVTFVKTNTWFWVDPADYKKLKATAAAGTVSATITVEPVALTYIPGDGGSTVTCQGPGTPWTRAVAGVWSQTPSPEGCSYKYETSTYGYPGGLLTATWGIVWQISWTSTIGLTGTLPDRTTLTDVPMGVAEAQTVVIK